MDSLPERARFRFGRMLNSAVAVINNSTLRRRSHFARSATTNSYGPIPIDGDSSVPLMYSSQRSNSTTSSNNSIVSIPGYGTVTNLIQVRSLEQSVENDLNALSISETATPSAHRVSALATRGFIKVAEYMYITDNKDLLDKDGFASHEISHIISLGDDCSPIVSVSKKEGLLVICPLTLFHETDVDPKQPFKNLVEKFDKVNMFIDNARKLSQKVVIYSKNKIFAYFVAAQFNIDYYQLEPGKAVNHLMKLIGTEWEELPEEYMDTLAEWRALGLVRRAQAGGDNERKLSISVNCTK
ncbi:unnamed protein product [Caenorhabditis sp. 36 PRJEB53466]|nr:unnamed protein product [Caenorhabditis sp. 36 PRJEB53466]